ncbi:CybS-domain-containing protein, partial [Lentinula lateritia]
TWYPLPELRRSAQSLLRPRLVSAALVPMTVAAFATSRTNYPIFDGILGLSLIIHSHIGFDSSAVNYLHPCKFSVLGLIVKWTLRAATVGTMVGVYQFNTNDIGALRM